MVVQTMHGIREWRSTRLAGAGRDVRLTFDDFGVRCLPVTASPQLTSAGTVSVAVAWDGDSQVVSLGAQRMDTLVYPSTATMVTCTCALARDGRTLTAEVPITEGTLALDLGLFREAGSHTVTIEIAFSSGVSLVALEVKPEAAEDRAALVFSFTTEAPTRAWTWLAPSPFTPGYRYRVHRAGAEPDAWSAPQSPFRPLRLDATTLPRSGPA